jgi:hypothetical protein
MVFGSRGALRAGEQVLCERREFRRVRSCPGSTAQGRGRKHADHRAQAQSQPRSAMAHAILLPTEQEPLKTHPKLTFEKNGYSYVVERHGDSSTYTVRNGKGEELTLPIKYAFGVHMLTFVFRYQDRFYESLVSYYPKLGGLNITLL